MTCGDLFDKIDFLYEDYVRIWADVCNIESPTIDKAAVDKVGKYFINLAKNLDWDVEVFEQPVSGNVVCITMNTNSKEQPISISGHLDTVHSIGSFGYPAVKIKNGKIYGPGVMDCKGGVVAGVLAMHALKESGFTDRPVLLLLQTDEECGSRLSNKATINYICEKAKNSVAFLNLEGHEDYFNGKACLERKGILSYKFIVKGKETHSSYCADEGANAIVEAAYKIIELEKIKDSNGITCNCGVINGGTVANTVAGECEFRLDVRFANEEQEEWIKNYVQKIAETVYVKGCTCSVEQVSFRVAMELCDRNVELLNKINLIFKENGLSTLSIGKRRGGSDAADVTAYGIPCIDSLGVKGERAHSVEEQSDLKSLKESAKRIASIIRCYK